jgi:hypothetical protein
MSRSVFCFAALLILAVPFPGQALDFEYIKIADTSTVVPSNSSQTFTSFAAPHLDGYNVVFSGASVFGAQGNRSGDYMSIGGVLSRIADLNTPAAGSTGNYTSIGSPAVSGTNVVFLGSTSSSSNGFYLYPNGLPGSRVLDVNTAIPSGSGNFTSFAAPSISGTNIAFYGAGTGQGGTYSTAGGLHAAANLNTAVPGGTGNFSDFGTLPTIRNAQVAFLGYGTGQQGLYTETGGVLAKVVDTSTIPPDSAVSFTSFSNPSFDGGSVAFHAFSGGGVQNGIYSTAGGLNAVADSGTAIPGGSGNFTSLGDNTAIDGGSVVFTGSGSGSQSGIYTNYGGVNTVVNNTTFVNGQLLTGYSISHDAISRGNFAFAYSNSPSNSGIYVAEQSYDYTANATGTWDTASNWSFGLKPRTAVYTNIHPDNGVLITGPSTPTTIRGLDLGANNSGQAELRLQPGGQLTVNEYLYVEDRGKLNLNGGVVAVGFGAYNYGELDLGSGGQISGGFLSNVGTLHGSGTVGSDVFNYGTIQAINSQMQFTASVSNAVIYDASNHPVNIGQIDVRDSQLQFTGGLTNQGHLNFSFGTSDVFGAVNNSVGDMSQPGGQVIISGNSNVTFYGSVVHNGAVFRVSAGSTAVFFGPVSGAGAFTGTCTKIFEGGYSPGNSPAAVVLDGPVVFDTPNTLKIELGGVTPGTQYDQVHATGSLTLGGALQVSLINSFTPTFGNKFDILDWGTRSGTFSSIQLPALSPTLAWSTAQLYTAGVLSVVDINLQPGDFNRDHQVTAADIPAMLSALTDLNAYKSQNGLSDANLVSIGDLNNSGALTNADIQSLLDLIAEQSGGGSAAAVPEPASIVLLALALPAFTLVLRRKRVD